VRSGKREIKLKRIDCEWDDWNINHIYEHDVEPYEVEEVFVNHPLIRKGKEGKYLAWTKRYGALHDNCFCL
jgi:hypothetical protein